MEGASFEQRHQAEKKAEYLDFIEVLGLTPAKKDLLRSLVEKKRRGRLIIALHGTQEEVLIDPSMEENEIAVYLLHGFDILAAKADPHTSLRDIEVDFQEMGLH